MYNLKVEPRNTIKEGCTWLSAGFITSCLQIFPFASNGRRGKIHVSVYLNHQSLQRRKRVGGRRGKGRGGWEKKKSAVVYLYSKHRVLWSTDMSFIPATWYLENILHGADDVMESFPPPPLTNRATGWFSSLSLSHFLFRRLELFQLQLTAATSPSGEPSECPCPAAARRNSILLFGEAVVTLARVSVELLWLNCPRGHAHSAFFCGLIWSSSKRAYAKATRTYLHGKVAWKSL